MTQPDIVTTFFLTVIGGVTIFSLGQMVLRLIIEPVMELRRLIGEIAFSLIYYADVLSVPVAIAGPGTSDVRRAEGA